MVCGLVAQHHGEQDHEGGKWTVPVGGGFGGAFQLDEQPINLDLDAYHNVFQPKAGNDTRLLQVTLTFQFPDEGSEPIAAMPARHCGDRKSAFA
jgi:hypothetical protein